MFFAIKSSGGVDRGRHLARLKLEILEFFGVKNRGLFRGTAPARIAPNLSCGGSWELPCLADGPPGGFSASDEQMSDDSEKRSKPISFNVMPVQNEQIKRAAASEGLATASYVRRVVVTLKRAAPSPGPAMLGRLLAT